MSGKAASIFRTQTFWFWLIMLLLAVAATTTILFATRMGAALSDDSYFYIKPARDLLAGRTPGFSPHYPPLVPLVVAGIGLGGIEPQQGIRLLNACLFGVNVLLAGWLVYRLSNSRGAGAAGAVLFFSSQVMVEDHAWAMSEALYIIWMLAILLALEAFFARKKLGFLVLAGVLAGCAALTRYSGLGLILGGMLAVLLASGRHWFKTRLRNAVLFGGIAGFLFFPYLLFYGEAFQKIRSFEGSNWAWLGLDELSEGFYNILLWLMPGRLARDQEALLLATVVVGALLCIGAYAAFRRASFQANLVSIRCQPVYLVILLMILANLFTLYQARISPVYRSPLDSRLLSPTHALFLVVVCGLLGLVWQKNGWLLKAAVAALFIWGLFLYVPRSIDFVTGMHENGAGFANQYWTGVDAGSFFQEHPQSDIITTAPMGVYFSLGLETPGITPMNPVQLRERLKKNRGYLMVFHSMPLEMYGYPENEFLNGLVKVDEYSDCTVYQAQE